MKSHRFLSLACLSIAGLGLAACSGSSSSPGPALSQIPPQTSATSQISLDVAQFVNVPLPGTLDYEVTSGGGTFDGTMYEHTFPTIGEYAVSFTVDNGTGVSAGTFEVTVTEANLALVQLDGKALQVLDTGSGQLVQVSESSFVETFRAGLSRGQFVFERAVGSNIDLFVFDVAARRPITLGDESGLNERFQGKTSDDRVVFSTETATESDLWIWGPETGLTRSISAIGDELERNPVVTDTDLVFFERSDDGNGDIYYYDSTVDASVAVSTDAGNETLSGAVAGGAVVFVRPGSVSESDLYYFSRTEGLLEVGQDVASIAALNKAFHGGTSAGRVVFSATGGGATNIYVWDPIARTTALASSTTTAEVNTFHAVTPGDFVVFTATDSGNPGTDDVFGYSVVGDAVEQANAGNVTHAFAGAGQVNGDDFVVYTIPGGATSLHVYNFASDSRRDATVASYQFDDVLPDGRVVITQTTAGGGLFVYDADADAMTTVVSGVGVPSYQGPGADAGDVVFELDVAAQVDVFLWDDSATALVTVSDDAAVDRFQVVDPGGDIVFSRVLGGNTNADLFVFDPVADTATRLTLPDAIGGKHDHAVVGSYSAAR